MRRTNSGLATVSAGSSIGVVAVSNSVNEAMNTAAETLVTLDTDIYDPDGYHDPVTNNGRLTVPTGKAGGFLWQVNIGLSANPAEAYIAVKKNGTTEIGRVYCIIDSGFIAGYRMIGSNFIQLADADWLGMYNLAVNPANMVAVATVPWFSLIKLY